MGNGYDSVVGRIPATDLKAQENAHLFVQTVHDLFPKIDTDKNKFLSRAEIESAAANGFRGETDVQQKTLDILLKNYDIFSTISQVGACDTSNNSDTCNGTDSAVTLKGIDKLAPAMFGQADYKQLLQDNPKYETGGQMATEALLATAGAVVGTFIGTRFGLAGGVVCGLIGMIAPPVAMNIGVSEYNAWKIGHQWDKKWAPEVSALQQQLRELK